MDSSDRSNELSEIPNHRWAKILGNVVAFITLVLPLLAIASNSVPPSMETFSPVKYSQPTQGK